MKKDLFVEMVGRMADKVSENVMVGVCVVLMVAGVVLNLVW